MLAWWGMRKCSRGSDQREASCDGDFTLDVRQKDLAFQSCVIVSFADKASEDIFDGTASRAARQRLPPNLWNVARRKLDQLNVVRDVAELRVPPGNRLERLRGDRAGQHSIRINDQYRVCFVWTDQGPSNVEVVDYH